MKYWTQPDGALIEKFKCSCASLLESNLDKPLLADAGALDVVDLDLVLPAGGGDASLNGEGTSIASGSGLHVH